MGTWIVKPCGVGYGGGRCMWKEIAMMHDLETNRRAVTGISGSTRDERKEDVGV